MTNPELEAEELPAEPVAEETAAEAAHAEPVEAEPAEAEPAEPEPASVSEESAAELTEALPAESVSAEELLGDEPVEEPVSMDDAPLKAVLEAIIYVTDEPLTIEQLCTAVQQPHERVLTLLEQLCDEYDKPDRGLSIREIAGGFKMSTKPEHHEGVRRFVRNLNPPLKLSLPALETLAVIAYKQPITAPEIMEIRGVQGAGVLKTLLDRKLISTSGRKQVIGKPILYRTTKDFLVQFGLKDLHELPTLKEFQELARLDTETPMETEPAQATLLEMPAPEAEDSVPAAVAEEPQAEEPQPEAEQPVETAQAQD